MIDKITIHIAQKHTCGRTLETIFQVKDAKLEGFINTHYSQFEPIRNDEFRPHIEPATENKLELSGSLGGVEFTACTCLLSRRERMKRWVLRLLSLFRRGKA